jgi:hypothetical protein
MRKLFQLFILCLALCHNIYAFDSKTSASVVTIYAVSHPKFLSFSSKLQKMGYEKLKTNLTKAGLGDEAIEVFAKKFGVRKVVNNIDDLVSWANKNGLKNLSQAEIKGTFDLFDGNISLSQKALLSTKEIVLNKNINEIVNVLKLPIKPKASSLSPYEARVWYTWRKSQISATVNRSKGLEAAAREAVEMRNTIRTTARTSMKDSDIADFLNSKEANKTFEIMYKEKSASFSNQDDIYSAIIESSMKGRDGVDVLYKIPKQ